MRQCARRDKRQTNRMIGSECDYGRESRKTCFFETCLWYGEGIGQEGGSSREEMGGRHTCMNQNRKKKEEIEAKKSKRAKKEGQKE